MPCNQFGSALLALPFFVALSVVRVAAADENLGHVLRGTYAFTETRICNQQQVANVSGTFTYNGDGTGNMRATVFTGAKFTLEAELAYVVNADGSFIQALGIVTATDVSGIVVTTTTGIQTHGQISADKQVLTVGGLNPNVETLTNVSDGSSATRTCARNGVAVKMRAHR